MHEHIQRALAEELLKRVIERIPASLAPFVMAAFVVAKPDGRVRLILDRRPINVYIRDITFVVAKSWTADRSTSISGR
jgi:hypothetical protein